MVNFFFNGAIHLPVTIRYETLIFALDLLSELAEELFPMADIPTEENNHMVQPWYADDAAAMGLA